jgi:hypothetical protein
MIDVVIVGFGFSAIPLVRELEATGAEYKIISTDGNSVWDALRSSGRMDFDLVSSYLTSFFSFDLAEDFEHDYYPRATEFHEMHRKWQRFYAAKIVRDTVTRVENFPDHSIVYTESGNPISARHVVFSTGFGRAILRDLTSLDYDAANQTFVFDTIGDSANLLMANLIPRNAKVIVRTNGFHPRDKVVPAFGSTHTLDQLEFHNYRYVSHDLYADIVYGATAGTGDPILIGDQFPVTHRNEGWNNSRSRPLSGTVAIKYWPIDEYCRNFGGNLTDAISKGYLLNDVAMWLHTGRIIAVPRDTPVDLENKTICYGGIERKFHRYVKGEVETPRLPPILIDGATPYSYIQRDCFMGVIPKALSNIYLMGYTRPYTGGLANIVEMQGLLVHKLVTQPDFYQRIHRNLEQRIAAYNEHYYGDSPAGRYDHLIYAGFYTDDIARLIGIDYKPQDCKTLQDLMFYYAFPNNAFKYRAKGEYAVRAVDGLVDRVNIQFKNFIVPFAYLLACSDRDAASRPDWFHQVKRHFFNDMRHKERYRLFLENYFRAYRRVKGIRITEREDPEWDAMVACATQARNKAVSGLKEPEEYQMDADMAREIALIESWSNGTGQPVEPGSLKLDPKHEARFAALLNPPEYELPFLRD